MNILQITHQYPPKVGGVGTHVAEISKRLADCGHNVTVFSADRSDVSSRESIQEGVTVRRFRSFAPNGAFHLAPGISPAIRRSNVDVVHAHNYHALVGLSAALGVTSERFIFTAHYHGGSASSIRDHLLTLYRPIGRQVLSRAHDVIAVSDWERGRLRADFDIEANVVPNGIDVSRFASAEPIKRERPYLLCVGRLEEYKGVQHAIRALSEVPDYDLLVAGTGPYRDQLERVAAEASVTDRVTFLGHVSDERLPRLYAGADVFITLSSFEAFGMTVAEALAAGTPCVVRNKGALRDWADVPGVVDVDTITQKKIVGAIERSQAIEVNVELPTWDDVTEQLLSVYRC